MMPPPTATHAIATTGCTHDCNQGRTCTCQASDDIEDAMFFHDLVGCLIVAVALIAIGMVMGVALFRVGMLS